jgi:hypothetical protein
LKLLQPPVPKKPWTDIFNATVDGSPCIQLNQFDESQVLGSEDCLLLNVYTKNLAAKTKEESKPGLKIFKLMMMISLFVLRQGLIKLIKN